MSEHQPVQSFMSAVASRWHEGKTICIGLDPVLERIPSQVSEQSVGQTLVAFNTSIVDATAELACAFKPNSAFFEMHGAEGIAALEEICAYIRNTYPTIPVILDAKRADIGSTNVGYAEFAFNRCRAGAVTVHPYLGREALEPLISNSDHAVFVLCRTSNPGAGEFQDLVVNGEPLYLHVARTVARRWNSGGNCGLVAGATYPQEIARIRAEVGTLPLLVPGIGTQGGDIEEVVKAGMLLDGGGLILNVSRAVLYASSGSDFAEAARAVTQSYHDQVDRARRRYVDRSSDSPAFAPSVT